MWKPGLDGSLAGLAENNLPRRRLDLRRGPMSIRLQSTNAPSATCGSAGRVVAADSAPTDRRRNLGAGACAVALSLLLTTHALDSSGDEPKVKVTDGSFKCITAMTKVRHFYVDNLLGNLADTVAVATAGSGDYPEGSVVQLMPNEVMIKQQKGYSPVTRDWEFFWIDVDKNGSKIYTRGFAEVNNRFGLNCFTCHVKARPEFDFICETEHGCDPIPVTKAMFGALQRTDPRCEGSDQVSAEDAEALRQLGELVKALTEKKQ
jgi:hypothetical protein